MPAPATEQIDVQALLERLRDEVRWGGNGSALTLRARARSAAEQFWAVTAERPPHGGPPARFLKRLLRRAMRWYVEPLAQQQRSFNDAALKLVDALFEELDRSRADVVGRARLVAELEERLVRLERRPAGAAGTVAAQPAADALPDYFAFESRMRGPTELVRERQRPYVEELRAHAPVLDVGCGRGELLALLRDAGVAARGVDADADMVAFARGEGLEVEHADLLAHLDAQPDGGLGAVFAGQVVEHLPPPALLRFLETAHAKLRDGGVLIAETINPLSPLALRNYFADLTHAQPLVPETLAQLVRHAGFRDVETRYLHEPDRGDATGPVADVLFAPLDYAIHARR
jgi:O-antigen chain-terminating methyltransferase